MAKQYDNDFKVVIAELYKYGIKAKQLSNDYSINDSIIDKIIKLKNIYQCNI